MGSAILDGVLRKGLIKKESLFIVEPNKEQKKYVAVDNDNEAFTTEYIKKNIHAHAVFLNYDFEQNKSCLYKLENKGARRLMTSMQLVVFIVRENFAKEHIQAISPRVEARKSRKNYDDVKCAPLL